METTTYQHGAHGAWCRRGLAKLRANKGRDLRSAINQKVEGLSISDLPNFGVVHGDSPGAKPSGLNEEFLPFFEDPQFREGDFAHGRPVEERAYLGSFAIIIQSIPM